MRDYVSEELRSSEHLPAFHANGYFHIHYAIRRDPKGNLLKYLSDSFPLVME